MALEPWSCRARPGQGRPALTGGHRRGPLVSRVLVTIPVTDRTVLELASETSHRLRRRGHRSEVKVDDQRDPDEERYVAVGE
ncbi:MAG: hypothetical protein GQE15_11285 [Archangiaceae bacterium]|nr:hypothetical protein [Archangiaceae bacterium]